MTQIINQQTTNIQSNQRPQSPTPTLQLKRFFNQSFNKLAIINPLKNLFQNVSKIKQENSSINMSQKNNSLNIHNRSNSNSNININDSSLSSIKKSNILKEFSQVKLNNQENCQQLKNNSNNLNENENSQLHQHQFQQQISSQIKIISQKSQKNVNNQSFSKQKVYENQSVYNKDQKSISRIDIDQSSSNNHNQHSLNNLVEDVDLFLDQQEQDNQNVLLQKQKQQSKSLISSNNNSQNNFFQQKQQQQQSVQNSSIIQQNHQPQQGKGTSAISKLTDFVVRKSPQKFKQKQNEVNHNLINKLENLNASKSSHLSVNVSRQIVQNSSQNILIDKDSKQFKKKDQNNNILPQQKEKNHSFINLAQQNSLNGFNNNSNNSNIESKYIKKSQTKQGTSVIQEFKFKNTSSNFIQYKSQNQEAIFQKSKYEIPNTNTISNDQNDLAFNSNFNKQSLLYFENIQINQQNDGKCQEIDQGLDIRIDKLQSQNYEQQYQRIFQSANFQLNQFNGSRSTRSPPYQNKIRKRVQTQMNAYDKKNHHHHKDQQKGKFSKIKKNQQPEDRIFNTQINSLGTSKVTRIIQAKQYKKKLLEQELAKVSAQIQNLHKKQVQARQFHSPKQFVDRVKINDDPLARKKAISLVKNLRVQKVQRVKAKISEFEHVDKKINDYMNQLAKIRQENQLRTKQKKKLEIIERMKQKQMQKMKQQKKINANVQFVHQFKHQKPQSRGIQAKNLKPNSPSIKSPQSKQRRRSQWSQAQQDGATPQLANKKAYLNKIRNLSNKKSSKLDMYQNKLN